MDEKNNLIIFDEFDDMFKSNNFEIPKSLINFILEENKVPTIWITNSIRYLDNAYIRRFDIVVNFKIPPKNKRFEIIKKHTKGEISDKTAKKISKLQVPPALVSRANRVILEFDSDKKDEVFKKVIKANLKAQGIETKIAKKPKQNLFLPKSYDIEFLNTDANLNQILDGLKNVKSAKICLYGRSGTGKSAYAKFIAKKLNKKLILKKGSDILDKYVGESEKNIAQAFREAKKKGAILVFDEVDNFLFDREFAKNSWEISGTNEMLNSMESLMAFLSLLQIYTQILIKLVLEGLI